MIKWLPAKKTQTAFCAGLLLVTALNIPNLLEEIRRIDTFQKTMPNQVIGEEFFGIRAFTRDIPFIGYFTDQDLLKNQAAAKKYAHAQFILAPTVLEKDNFQHEYILFVCENPNVAIAVIKKLNLRPVKGNSSGMILAKRP